MWSFWLETNLFIFLSFVYVLLLERQLSRGRGGEIPLTNITTPRFYRFPRPLPVFQTLPRFYRFLISTRISNVATCLSLSHTNTRISNVSSRGLFMFNNLRWVAIVRFVDTGGIVDHHCLINFLFIRCQIFKSKRSLSLSLSRSISCWCLFVFKLKYV